MSALSKSDLDQLEALMREHAMSIGCNYDYLGTAHFRADAYVDQDTITRKGASLYGVISECIEAASKVKARP